MDFLQSMTDVGRPEVARKPWFDEVTMTLVTEPMLDSVIDECIAAGVYALDLETTGLDNRVFDGRTKNSIVGFCLSPDGRRGYYIPVRHRAGVEHNLAIERAEAAIRRLVTTEGTVAIFHNAKFDQEFLQYGGGEPIGTWDNPADFEDTLILAWLRNTRQFQRNLKLLSKEDLGKEMIELEDLFGRKHDLDFSELDPSWEPCIWYACSDAICTRLLFDVLQSQVIMPDGDRKKGQEAVYKLEKMCTPATRWMERCRVWIDRAKVAELTQLGQVEYFEAMRDIYDFCNEKLASKREQDHDENNNPQPASIEPGWFRLLRKRFKPNDPDYNINQQIDDCRKDAHRFRMDDLDAKGHFFKIEGTTVPAKYDILSRQQLGPLFQELEIPDLQVTEKSEQIQTTQAEIERLTDKYGHKYPFLPKISRLGELQKALGTYLISMHNDVGPDGTLRVNYNQCGTDTGRYTTPTPKDPAKDGGTKFPMHGTPAIYDKSRPQCLLRIREAIKARPGKIMAAIDFGGVELRIATILSGEPLWLREYFRCSSCGHQFSTGDGTATPEAPPPYCPTCGDDRIGDLHTLTAITFFGENAVGGKQWKQMRQSAKSANFAMAYGGGPSALLRAIEGCTEQEAARHHRAFQQTYQTLKVWWDTVKDFGRRHGYVKTIFGRQYPIPDIQLPISRREVEKALNAKYEERIAQGKQARPVSDGDINRQMELNRKFRAKAERNATNGPIQGLSADITKLAMALIYKECRKRNWLEKVYMIITIHDELVFEIDEDILVEALEVFQDLMTRNKTILGLKWAVPLTTDCEIGVDWTVPWNIKDFQYRRVRADGLQVDEKGRIPRDRDTGRIKTKIWPLRFVKIFGDRYGYARVLENPSEEEGRALLGPDWQPLPVDGDAPSAPSFSPPVGVPPPASQEAPQPSQEAGGAPVAVAAPTGPVGAPGASPSPLRPHGGMPQEGAWLERGQPYEFRVPKLGVGMAYRLAQAIVECRGKGSHPLRVIGPNGESLLWEGADILVSPLEFEITIKLLGVPAP
jgi:DNA polymerase I-like protein with 3'-5' exonuclease and polymerase domains